MHKKKKILSIIIGICILIVGVFTRLFLLDKIPMGLKDDEMDFVLSAKSVFLNGKTLEGKFSPFSFKPVPKEAVAPSARTPYMLQSPIIGSLPLGLFNSKIGYATTSVLLIVVLFFIVFRFWGINAALCAAAILAVNPWAIHLGRTAFDAPISIFLAYMSFGLFLACKDWWILLSLLPWIIGLQAYHGINIIYPVYLAIFCFSSWQLRKKKYTKQYIVSFGIGVVCFLLFLGSVTSDRVGSRLNELLLPTNPRLVSVVNSERRRSIQTPINQLLSNRYTVFAREFTGKYLSSFSTIHLFVSGEGLPVYSLRLLGFFYPIDLLLIAIGLFVALKRYRKKAVVWIALLVISPIPTALSYVETSFGQRSAMLYPILCMFAGLGMATVFESKKLASIWKFLLGAIYAVFFVYFLYVYFIFNPVNNSEAFGLSYRVLANYLHRIPKNQRAVVITNGSLNVFKQYLFYSDALQTDTISEIQSKFYSKQYALNNVEFINCPEHMVEFPKNTIVISPYKSDCQTIQGTVRASMIAIAQLEDSGRIYEIYNDTLCSKYTLSEYQKLIRFQDLSIEKLDAQRFCETYLSKPYIMAKENSNL